MDYNYESILNRYRMNYAQRAEGTASGSVERRTYEFIVKLLDGALINPSEERRSNLSCYSCNWLRDQTLQKREPSIESVVWI